MAKDLLIKIFLISLIILSLIVYVIVSFFIILVFSISSCGIIMISSGSKYSASSIPSISSIGVAIGAGITYASSVSSSSRNPSISDTSIRWSFIGSSLCETSGSTALVHALPTSYASFSPFIYFGFIVIDASLIFTLFIFHYCFIKCLLCYFFYFVLEKLGI